VEVEPRTEVSHFPESDNEMQVEINNWEKFYLCLLHCM
jgi:hypothetical protein